jgi:hypothetical protein
LRQFYIQLPTLFFFFFFEQRDFFKNTKTMDRHELKALKEFVLLLQKEKEKVENFDFHLEKTEWLDKWTEQWNYKVKEKIKKKAERG